MDSGNDEDLRRIAADLASYVDGGEQRHDGGFFGRASDSIKLPPVLSLDMERLAPESRATVIHWLVAYERTARDIDELRVMLKQIAFDIKAADLGAYLHRIGNC